MDIWIKVELIVGYYEGNKPINKRIYIHPTMLENFKASDKEHIAYKVKTMIDDLKFDQNMEVKK